MYQNLVNNFFSLSLALLITFPILIFFFFMLQRSWKHLQRGSKSLYDIWSIICFCGLILGFSFVLILYFYSTLSS